MRDVIFAIVIAMGVLWLALVLTVHCLDSHDARQSQLRNAYWPFTVELQVHDL